MFRQISPVQLNTLALKYVHDIRKKYPASGVLNNIESELIDELVTNHEVKFEDFHEVPKRFEYPQMEELNQLTQSDLISWKNKCGDFYLNAFYSDLKDTALIRKFGAAAVKLEQSKNEEQLTYKEKEKRKQAYEAMLREKGFPEKYNKAIIVDPLYIDLNLDSERSFTNSQKYKLLLDEVVNEFKLNFNIDVKLLSMRDLDENSISSYNQLCEMKEWRDELLTNNTCKHMPLSTVTDSRDDAEKVILCFPVILKDNGIEYYRISYYDYHTGNQIFTNSASLLSFNSVKDLFYKDLIILTKK